ncbi:11762_t:CDS:2, partial [Dentiscutata heterogama]
FLLSNEIPAAFDVLKEEMPTETKEPFPTTNMENLVGRPHVGVYTIIEEFQNEQQKVKHQVEAIIHGVQRQTPKKGTIEREQ